MRLPSSRRHGTRTREAQAAKAARTGGGGGGGGRAGSAADSESVAVPQHRVALLGSAGVEVWHSAHGGPLVRAGGEADAEEARPEWFCDVCKRTSVELAGAGARYGSRVDDFDVCEGCLLEDGETGRRNAASILREVTRLSELASKLVAEDGV